MGFRFTTLILGFGLLFSALTIRLYTVQIRDGETYEVKAESRIAQSEKNQIRRGEISFTDKNNNKISVALNRDYPVIYAEVKSIKDKHKTAEVLAPILATDTESLYSVFQKNSENMYKVLIEKPGDMLISTLEQKKTEEQTKEALEEININYVQYRLYPFASLGSHVLGYVGLSDETKTPKGMYGLEKLYNDNLAVGEGVQLTIDRNLQTQSEKILKDLLASSGAEKGTVIIQNPKTGAILALANNPDFDPNDYKKSPVENFTNTAVQHMYEPGSVFKPITMVSALDAGAVTPQTTYTDKGYVTLNGKKITNWDHGSYGTIPMGKILERSINTGSVFVESKLGNTKFYDYVKKFGFGEKTGIALPEEQSGNIKNLERKEARQLDFATASFGQGIAVTPMQMITAFSVIANGGTLMEPYIDASKSPTVVRRVVSEKATEEVRSMLESAAEKGGVAVLPQWRIAGKTGTAQIPDFIHGGYTESYVHTFIGMAPVSDPQFVILVKIDKPNAEVAALTVVPAFRDLAQFTLSYFNVTPDKIQTNTKTNQ